MLGLYSVGEIDFEGSVCSVLVVTGRREDYDSRILLLYLFCNTCNISSEMLDSIFLGLGISVLLK